MKELASTPTPDVEKITPALAELYDRFDRDSYVRELVHKALAQAREPLVEKIAEMELLLHDCRPLVFTVLSYRVAGAWKARFDAALTGTEEKTIDPSGSGCR